MKRLLLALTPCLSVVHGQSTWSLVQEVEGYNSWARDVVELQDGYIVAATALDGPPGASGHMLLLRLDLSGNLIAEREFWPGLVEPDVCTIQPTRNAGKFIAFGVGKDQSAVPAMLRYVFDPDLIGIDSTRYEHPGLEHVRMDNVIPDQDGGHLLLGAGNEISFFPDTALILHLSAEGQTLTYRGFSAGSFQLNPRMGIPNGSGFTVAFVGNIAGLGQPSASQFVQLNSSLEPISAFAGNNLFGGLSLIDIDSVISDHPYIIPLASGNSIISGRYGDLIDGMGSALEKVGPDGQQLATIFARSEFLYDQVGALQACDLTPDGHLLFVQVENVQPFSFFNPGVPSRVRVLKVDTALNVLCERVMNGFADNQHHVVTRIKSTADGGYLLIGFQAIPGVNSGADLWVEKFPALECDVHVQDSMGSIRPLVFPNPGTRFQLTLNGRVITNGYVELWNAQGQMIQRTRLEQDQAFVDGSAWPSGIYGYRVVDGSGNSVARGTWVRE